MGRPKAASPRYSICRRGKRWYVQWWRDGRAWRVSCRTESQTEARRFLAEFRAGTRVEERPDQPTIGAILTCYLADRGPKTFSRTIEYDCAALTRGLEDLPADLLSDQEVAAYVDARRKAGARGASAPHRKHPKPLSDGTIIRELGTLRSALAWAVRKKWIASAPDVERPESPPARERWLSREEAAKLIAGAKADHVRLFIVTALQTAARAGAVLDLTWDRIDFESQKITLGRGHGRKRRAVVPITSELLPALREASEARTCAYVIEHGARKIGSIKTGFRAAVRRAGLVGVTPHVLRHTAATWMVMAGLSYEEVGKYLGDSKETVERVYGHHSPEWLREAGRALAGTMAEKTGPQSQEKNDEDQDAAGED